MSETVTTIAAKASRLSARQRIALIERLWESLDDSELPALSSRQKDELDARHSRFVAEPQRARPADIALDAVRSEFKRIRTRRGNRA